MKKGLRPLTLFVLQRFHQNPTADLMKKGLRLKRPIECIQRGNPTADLMKKGLRLLPLVLVRLDAEIQPQT